MKSTNLNVNQTLTDTLIDDLFLIVEEGFPESSMHHAKNRLLDYLGVTLAGSRMIDDKAKVLLNQMESNDAVATVIGFKSKTSLLNAVLINGLSSHVAELDDGERFAMMHPGAPIISALLPLAETRKISGLDLLKGIIIGYEASIRIARSIQPAIKERGYHATGVCGTLGAAIGVAAALSYSKAEMKAAIAAAATGSAGILEVIDEGSQLKPYNAAHAAVSGLMAAFMAKAGFAGPSDVLGGKRGFFKVMTDKFDSSLLDRNPDDYLRVENAYVKPYAACRHCHPAIEAGLNVLNHEKINPHEISSIRVDTYYWAVGGHDHADIQGVSSAKMSTPYSLAVGLLNGKAGLYEFVPELINNAEVIELANKVSVHSDDELTGLFPHKRGAAIVVTMNDGRVINNRVEIPKGEPENPVTDTELKDKFVELALYGGKTSEEADDIFRIVMNVETELAKLYIKL
jgi:2-methylcitrate dehydratase PrpD